MGKDDGPVIKSKPIIKELGFLVKKKCEFSHLSRCTRRMSRSGSFPDFVMIRMDITHEG